MTTSWNLETLGAYFERPFFSLLTEAHHIHQQHFNENEIELCSLLSVKTGACPEDCAYCPQSGHYQTNVEKENILDLEAVKAAALAAKKNGAKRFCMGAAWRNPPVKQFPKIVAMIKAVKALGLETCVTLGMLDQKQALELKEAGLDYYNHNLDTSPEYYEKIITTRTYQDRLTTLREVREANIKVCCGGILGMGESREDRMQLLLQLASLTPPPESVPINRLIPTPGTPLAETKQIDNFEFIRTIAMTRIVIPTAVIRLSAGRSTMSQEMQALCLFAGANSIWLGDRLLTADNPSCDEDSALLNKLGLHSTAC